MQDRIILFILMILSFLSINGQERGIDIYIYVIDNTELSVVEKNFEFSDSSAIIAYVNKFHTRLVNNGYLTASVDSLLIDTLKTSAYLTSGQPYKWANISFENIPDEVLRNIKVDTTRFTDNSISLQELNIVKESIVSYYENNSYPFATVFLDNIELSEDGLQAELQVENLVRILVDSIHIKGECKISPYFIYRYIGIHPSKGYNEAKIRNIDRLLNEIQFINQIRPSEVEFYDDNADIFLYFKKRKANRFTGILGILPNNETTGKLLLTGELDFFLANSFGKGESIGINWRKLESSSQNLNIDVDYPFVFRSAIGLDYHFSLHKKDSTYLNVGNKVGVRFSLEGNNSVKAYFERRVSSLISTNTALQNSFSDFSLNVAGVGLNLRKLNNILNPGKGYFIDTNIGVGKKKLSNSDSEGEGSNNHYEIRSFAGVFVPIRGKFIMYIANRSIWLGDSKLYDNELMLLGGLNSLRGFDEASIPVSLFSSVTIEFRYLFEKNSNFFIFLDGAYYERNSFSGYVEDTPYGFGAGTSFETKAGIFTLSYGLGKQFDNPVGLDNAKIHFGFKSVF